METLISFLRGVNMAGHNKISMPRLAELLEHKGFRDVETYIQSGNIIFNNFADFRGNDISSLIEKSIQDGFGMNVPVMTRTIDEILEIISKNPFLEEENFDPAKMAVMFLHEEPHEEQIAKVSDVDYPPDKFRIYGKEIFIYCPNGFAGTRLYTNFFEKKMKINGTARNWNTVKTILKIAELKQAKTI